MRWLLVLVLTACGVPASSRSQRCDPDGIFVGGDVETVYGRLLATVARVYPSAIGDPLTRTIETDWESVPITQRSPAGDVAFSMRFVVTLEGQWPFRIRIASRALAHVRFLDTNKIHRVSEVTPPVEPERELAQLIRADFADFAVRCDNSSSIARCDRRPRGTPADFARPQRPDMIVVGEPRLCVNGGYVKVERRIGTRTLGVGRKHGTTGAIGGGCKDLPRDLESCTAISVVAVVHEAARRMRREGIAIGGTGIGECGQATGTYDVLDFGIKVFDWGDAGRAAEILAEVLAEYDLRGYAGITVGGSACGIAG